MTVTGMQVAEAAHIANECHNGYAWVYTTSDLKRGIAALEAASDDEWLDEYNGLDKTLIREVRARA